MYDDQFDEKEFLESPAGQTLIDKAKAHWKEFRPKMFKALKRDGTLNEAAAMAASQTYREQQLIMQQLEEQQGGPKKGYMDRLQQLTMNQHMAEELTGQKYILLPSEKDRPNL